MELQLTAIVASSEDGETVSITELTDPLGFLLLKQGDTRITVSIDGLKEAMTKLGEFNGRTT